MSVFDVESIEEICGIPKIETSDSGQRMTYIRPVTLENNSVAYGVYCENGTELAVFSTREAAFFSARQNNLTPMMVH